MYIGTDDDISEVTNLPQTESEDPETNMKMGNHLRL